MAAGQGAGARGLNATPLLLGAALLGAALGVVLLVVLLDQALAGAARRTVGRELAAALPGAPSPEVSLPGRWVGLRLLRRRVERLDVHVRDVPLGDHGARLATLDATLTDVRVGWPRGTTRGPGTFTAVLGPEAVEALTADAPVRVALDDGCVRLSGPFGAGIAADVEVEDGRLLVAPRSGVVGALVQTRAALDLPALPAGAVVRDVELTAARATLTGTLDLVVEHGSAS